MSDDHIDEETLAAFLDGRLAGQDRERVVRVLANSPDRFDEFREAAALARTLQQGEATPVRHVPRWRRTALIAIPVLAAAGIAGILFIPSVGTPDAITLAQASSRALAPEPAQLDRDLGPDWYSPGWAVNRGGSAGNTEGHALRMGARYAQLELAATAADSTSWRLVADVLAVQLGAVDVAGPASAVLRADGWPNTEGRTLLATQLRSLSGAPTAFDLGVWMESARLAALSGHLEFFDAQGSAVRVLRGLRSTATPGALAAPLDALAPFDAGDGITITAALALARLDTAFARIPR